MALASAVNAPNGLHGILLPSSSRHELTVNPAALLLPRQLRARFQSTLALARRKSHRGSAVTSALPQKIKKKNAAARKEAAEEDEVDGDAIDALFSLLEEDLRNNGVSLDDGDEDDEISEEVLARLEAELAEAFGAIDDVEEDEGEEDGSDGDDIEADATALIDEDDDVEVAVIVA